ncbi:MAG TPA: hypothetical protein VIJ86_00990 [Acidimicrobiales bacterium]
MSAVRSDGWIVRPSFSPHGPTAPVSLLFDEVGITQLAGSPEVAWQTPWSEVTHLRLVRRRANVTIVAVIANVLYQWRRTSPVSRAQLDELAVVVNAHGGREMPRSRRNAALAVALVVSLASFGGYFGSLFNTTSTPGALRALEAVNLSARDVSGTWAASSASATSELNTVMSPPGQVIYNNPATSTTIGSQNSVFSVAATHFQRCLGISNVDDRVYGLAGRAPTYQVSSPVFSSSNFGGVQVESSAQYYASTQNVADDVAEMSRPSFGRCFANSTADLMIGQSSAAAADVTSGVSLATPTFVKGWRRAGAALISLPQIGITRANLVVVVEASGHYEATLSALVDNLASARATINDLANALLLRVTSTTAVSA